MFFLDIVLVVSTPTSLLMVGDHLPTSEYVKSDRSLSDSAHGLFKTTLGIDARVWLVMRQVGIVESEVNNHKRIVYAVEMPECTSLPPGGSTSWVKIGQEVSSDVMNIVSLAWRTKHA